MIKFLHKNKGFSIIEVVVASAIVLLIGTGFTGALSQTIALSENALHIGQATSLLEEGAEAVKSIRDDSWTTISGLTVGTTYYLSFNDTTKKWALSTTANTIDSMYTRTVVVSAVNRDSNDDIASTGTLDASTKKVTINVIFNGRTGQVTKTLSLYISDIFN